MVPAKTPQDLIYDHFLNMTPLDEGGCLLDALLWRGFLAFRDERGIWLGKGSHAADIEVLQLIKSLEVNVIDEDSTRAAAVRCLGSNQRRAPRSRYQIQHRISRICRLVRKVNPRHQLL